MEPFSSSAYLNKHTRYVPGFGLRKVTSQISRIKVLLRSTYLGIYLYSNA